MRPVNLFLTEDGVLKLGYYGLITQAECYSSKKKDCYGIRSFAPEVFEGGYEMKSDVWSLGITMIEMMGITPHSSSDPDQLFEDMENGDSPFDASDIESIPLIDFLKKCFVKEVNLRWSVNELTNVSVL